ncbi:MAG: hypothetical protein V3V49_05840 [Candidatus Krumholzibacteria bacterium]
MAALACTDFDREKVQELYCSDVVAQAVFDYLKDHGAGTRETTLEGVENGLTEQGKKVSRSELIDFFKTLEALSLGTFIVGRRGRASRFRWSVNPAELAVVASGGIEDGDAAGSEGGNGGSEAETITHQYVLRPGFILKLRLPVDLSNEEASRLAGFLRSLPFE